MDPCILITESNPDPVGQLIVDASGFGFYLATIVAIEKMCCQTGTGSKLSTLLLFNKNSDILKILLVFDKIVRIRIQRGQLIGSGTLLRYLFLCSL
jgi:hypothetical protein